MESSEKVVGVISAGMTPEWLDLVLDYLTVAIVIVVVVRVLLALTSLFIRRRYNLTVAETTSKAASSAPSFLTVKSRNRDEILAKATAFDDRASTGEIAQSANRTGVDFYSNISRVLSVFVAVVSLATSVVGAAASVELFDKVGQTFSGWDRFTELIRTHWIGASIVVLVILIEIYRFLRSVRNPAEN